MGSENEETNPDKSAQDPPRLRDGDHPREKTVPYEEFQRVVRQKNDALEQLETTKGELAQYREKSATTDTLANRVRELEGELQKQQSEFRVQSTLMDHGILDAEGRDVAQYLYGKLPEEGRPELADWIKSARENPDEAPKALRPYLGTTEPVKPDPKSAPEGTLPKSNAGVDPSGATRSTGPSFSADRIREIREEAQRTGDWSKYREIRHHITGVDPKRDQTS